MTSTKLPIWADFYARCGIDPTSYRGRTEWNASWNEGFTDPDTDPTVPGVDGSINYSLLVRDLALAAAIPESASLILLGSGLAGLVGLGAKLK